MSRIDNTPPAQVQRFDAVTVVAGGRAVFHGAPGALVAHFFAPRGAPTHGGDLADEFLSDDEEVKGLFWPAPKDTENPTDALLRRLLFPNGSLQAAAAWEPPKRGGAFLSRSADRQPPRAYGVSYLAQAAILFERHLLEFLKNPQRRRTTLVVRPILGLIIGGVWWQGGEDLYASDAGSLAGALALTMVATNLQVLGATVQSRVRTSTRAGGCPCLDARRGVASPRRASPRKPPRASFGPPPPAGAPGAAPEGPPEEGAPQRLLRGGPLARGLPGGRGPRGGYCNIALRGHYLRHGAPGAQAIIHSRLVRRPGVIHSGLRGLRHRVGGRFQGFRRGPRVLRRAGIKGPRRPHVDGVPRRASRRGRGNVCRPRMSESDMEYSGSRETS